MREGKENENGASELKGSLTLLARQDSSDRSGGGGGGGWLCHFTTHTTVTLGKSGPHKSALEHQKQNKTEANYWMEALQIGTHRLLLLLFLPSINGPEMGRQAGQATIANWVQSQKHGQRGPEDHDTTTTSKATQQIGEIVLTH